MSLTAPSTPEQRWSLLLDELDRSARSGIDLVSDPSAPAWSVPDIDVPMPVGLHQRAADVLGRLHERMLELEEARDRVGSEIEEARRRASARGGRAHSGSPFAPDRSAALDRLV